jgi:hypothetical protein
VERRLSDIEAPTSKIQRFVSNTHAPSLKIRTFGAPPMRTKFVPLGWSSRMHSSAIAGSAMPRCYGRRDRSRCVTNIAARTSRNCAREQCESPEANPGASLDPLRTHARVDRAPRRMQPRRLISVEGHVKKRQMYALEDLIKGMTMEDRVYRMRCVEGWSMVIPWQGSS